MDRLKRAGPRKYFIAPIIILSLIIIALLVLTSALQIEIQPKSFRLFVVNGSPEVGSYTVLFALQDENQTNGPANGYVMLKIRDGHDTILHDSEFRVRSGDFRTYDDPLHGGRVIGYSWQIPVANISSGVPDQQGYGEAELTFLSFAGRSATDTYRVKIPSLPLP
ncbi:MAG: hypothetical protein FJZ49_06760 [Candidatus Verstraetearchaeota archaeon]|nr:hypothetical protein [Candidatus Verstraetearchaeota archaeon]